MAKKKTVEKPVPVDVLPVPVLPVKKEIILEGDPEAQLQYATRAANALMKVVNKKPNPVMIRGKQYLEYGDWQVLGRFYGATVEIEWTKPIFDHLKSGKIIGYEARALVTRSGEVISSAEGMCLRDEERWKDADEYAIRSMAQTRTAAKALRNAFGWVAELAGYSATPAEEMPTDTKPMPSYKVVDPILEQKNKIRDQLRALGLDLDTKEEYEQAINEITGLPLIEENFPAIIQELQLKIDADPTIALDRALDDKDKG